MDTKTPNDRTKAYAQRMRDKGLMKVCVWVPKDKAKELREEFKKLIPKD